MDRPNPHPEISWRYTKSGKRTVIQSCDIPDVSDASALEGWIITRIREANVLANVTQTEPYEAFDVDSFKTPAHDVSIRRPHGECGERIIEVRNISPEHFTEITGSPVIPEIQHPTNTSPKKWVDTAQSPNRRPPCQGF
ncbi:MAG: hypothetical protein ACK502_09410 [Alphaproteobacteria bacterium]